MKIKKYLQLLTCIDLFKSFTKEALLKLFCEENHQIKKYEKNSMIYLQNEVCNTVDVILRGEIVIQKIDTNGNILTLTSFQTGDIIGGNLLFCHNNVYPMTITSKTDCILLHMEKDFILELCQKNKAFLIAFLHCICDKTFILTNKLKAITMKTIKQRIIEFLTYEYYYQQSTKILLNMSKKELAERLGVQRPSLSRELNKMREDGLITYDAKSITIKNLNILELANE
ncbi:Crp/Fnr family transcriptional regulator [Clostridium formicaceticum]|uniref:CRP-like protein Clp n=1 Tax=Clostridium formicaceticum TaxID=1497 RepID=A0AAC9RQK4_9CLOT|nr:Crp/Fnr family transcriptional regulator [Clostridium formicaceticum]AOY74921.1 transcriptional regulator [Clostridium formicaceticum]ARE89328.1 CRP-like protein Clp [Clostridium formicaceticum]